MSVEKTELNELNSVKDEAKPFEHVSPTNVSDVSSTVSWNTPVSTMKSGTRSTLSSVSWNTPKSSKSPAEHGEPIHETDDNQSVPVYSPLMGVVIPDEDPPPYPHDERHVWSPARSIRDELPDGVRVSNSPELTKLIESSSSATSTPPVGIHTVSPVRSYRSRLSQRSFRNYRDEYPENDKESDTFARKYGTICIIAFFVVFLMILSLIAKFLIKKTLRI